MDSITQKALTTSDQINLDWLRCILSRRFEVEHTGIVDFRIDASASTNAQIFRIHLDYSSATREKLPATLILKICTGGDLFIGDSEVNYYARDYVNLANAPIPRCYDAQYSAENGSYHILMEDLTDTHVKDREPSLEYGVAVARSLASLHAHGWGMERLKTLGQCIPGVNKIDQFINHVRKGLNPLLEATKREMSEDNQIIISEIFQRYPKRMSDRTADASGFAVIHGDLNPGNILSPKQGYGQMYFLDRQPFHWSLTTWLAVSDLVIMMVPYWPTNMRRQLEMPILKEYHKQLKRQGITDYSWVQLLSDYRLSVIQSVYIATQWCIEPEQRERMHWLWWQELQNALSAISDLRCMELLA